MFLDFLHILLPSKGEPLLNWVVKLTLLASLTGAGGLLAFNLLENTQKGIELGIAPAQPPLNIETFITVQGGYWNYLASVISEHPEVEGIFVLVGVDHAGKPAKAERQIDRFVIWNWAARPARHTTQSSFSLIKYTLGSITRTWKWAPLEGHCQAQEVSPENSILIKKAHAGAEGDRLLVCPTASPGYIVTVTSVSNREQEYSPELIKSIQFLADITPAF